MHPIVWAAAAWWLLFGNKKDEQPASGPPEQKEDPTSPTQNDPPAEQFFGFVYTELNQQASVLDMDENSDGRADLPDIDLPGETGAAVKEKTDQAAENARTKAAKAKELAEQGGVQADKGGAEVVKKAFAWI